MPAKVSVFIELKIGSMESVPYTETELQYEVFACFGKISGHIL